MRGIPLRVLVKSASTIGPCLYARSPGGAGNFALAQPTSNGNVDGDVIQFVWLALSSLQVLRVTKHARLHGIGATLNPILRHLKSTSGIHINAKPCKPCID